jgi:hypothetical protein
METLLGLYRFQKDPKTRKKYGPPILGANVRKYELAEATKFWDLVAKYVLEILS